MPSSDLQGQWFWHQIRSLRGLRQRRLRLSQSQSQDQKSLAFQRERTSNQFQLQHALMHTMHADAYRNAVTNWDELLDRQMAIAERETLQSRSQEKHLGKQLRETFLSDKAKAKIEAELQLNRLKQELDESKDGLLKKQEAIQNKLDGEQATIDELAHDCREWIAMRTGNTKITHEALPLTEGSKQTLVAIQDLKQAGLIAEQSKALIARDITRLKSSPVVKLFGAGMLIMAGAIVGTIAGLFGFLAGLAPIIVAAVAVASGFVSMILLQVISTPMVSKSVRRAFPAIDQNEQLAVRALATGRRIADSNFQREIAAKDLAYRRVREELHQQFVEQDQKLKQEHATLRQTLAANRQSQHYRIDSELKPRIRSLSLHQAEEQKQAKSNYELKLATIEQDFLRSQMHVAQRWARGRIQYAERSQSLKLLATERFPDWRSDCYTDGNWPRHGDSLSLPIGSIQFGPEFDGDRSDTSSLSLRQVPAFYDLLSHGALIVDTPPTCKEVSERLIRNTLLRAVTLFPAGDLNVTIIDPEGLGKQFSWLMSLADADPMLVNHRVWTQSVPIAEQLSIAARQVEDLIQQSLRDRYKNLIEYNAVAGPMSVPYRLIVWANFPFGLDDHSWQSLCSILSSGGRCGVGVLLQVSTTHAWPTFTDSAKVHEFGLRLKLDADTENSSKTKITIDHRDFDGCQLAMEQPPDEERLKRIMEHQLEAALNVGKCIVPFDSIALPPAEQQRASSAQGLSISVGVADSGRVQLVKLGEGTAQHVLIAGKTGSGKSSLLHTLISSAAMKYDPSQLRLILLDFKKGVEFQVYAEAAISHADIIGIESKREFGVSALEYIDRLLNARGEAFRKWGVQDLPSLARKFPEHALPRILILIDEFQELFVEDDKVSQQASLLMDRVVRQGRSFGVHLILASQTLGGAYSLPRTTLSQMGVRIALQCDSSDAMLILSEDNPAAERLRHSGQAVYNESGGRPESNQNFQVAYVEKNEQLRLLAGLRKVPVVASALINPMGRQVVFEGHKPAIWDQAAMSGLIASSSIDSGSVPMILGDSVSIDPPVMKLLTRTAGRNVMVVGQDESSAASLIAALVTGCRSSSRSTVFRILDGSRKEDASMTECLSHVRSLFRTPQSQSPSGSQLESDLQLANVRGLDAAMNAIQLELSKRTEAPDSTYPSMILVIVNLARFRDLRRNEEYTYGEDTSGTAKPDAVLANVLRDGPALGIHVWMWADSAGTLARWVSRQSTRDIELRVLMQMSASDSNQLIDANTANRLERYVLLLHDDVDGKTIKFRPFDVSSFTPDP
jgi:DNA segregation ATPase FtsK/SpoIIIE, S-DNA-T family